MAFSSSYEIEDVKSWVVWGFERRRVLQGLVELEKLSSLGELQDAQRFEFESLVESSSRMIGESY